jgi:hypothetical protein
MKWDPLTNWQIRICGNWYILPFEYQDFRSGNIEYNNCSYCYIYIYVENPQLFYFYVVRWLTMSDFCDISFEYLWQICRTTQSCKCLKLSRYLLMTLLTKIEQFHLKLFSRALFGRTFDSCMSLSIISGLELSNEDISIRSTQHTVGSNEWTGLCGQWTGI